MWEYSASENRFGTPEALMLLPYWTNGCIDSMEGLLFESSADHALPLHQPGRAVRRALRSPRSACPTAPLDVTLGVQHLQLLGVKYFMAETPEVEQQATADPTSSSWPRPALDLQLQRRARPHDLEHLSVKDSPLVTPLDNDPVVLSGVKPAPSSWLAAVDRLVRRPVALERRAGPERPVVVAPHLASTTSCRRSSTSRRPRVTDVTQTDSTRQLPRVAGGDARAGEGVVLPQLARQRRRRTLAGHPEPHGGRADQPRRARSPTATSSADNLGLLATLLGLVGLVVLFVVPRSGAGGPRRGQRRSRNGTPAPAV